MSDTAIVVNFSGGCELLFGTKSLTMTVAAGTTLGALVTLLKARITERPEQFVVPSGQLRPGILALVNDTDAELLGAAEYVVEHRDQISFISTLHGG
jgi:ubiquitin related modifier 1